MLAFQLFLTQSSAPGLTISGCLSPVPHYIVKMIAKYLFMDIVLLRPCNLIFLPPVEPVGHSYKNLSSVTETLICSFIGPFWIGGRRGAYTPP